MNRRQDFLGDEYFLIWRRLEANGGKMGVRGLAPGKYFETTIFRMTENSTNDAITCFKSPYHEITTKFLANRAARQSLRSRIHELKISKSRNHAPKLAK